MKVKNPFIALFISLLTIPAFGQTVAVRADATLLVDGIQSKVTVRRDERAIPYIEATNDADLYFAQGFVTASDRLWQMDFLRRVARGELAEIFGKQVLEEDKRWRRYGFAKIAEESMSTLDPGLKKALEDYSRGVNAYIATLADDKLPIEFKILQYRPREWKPTDTVAVGKILADALSSTWRQDLIRASLQSLPQEKFSDLTNQITPQDVVLYGKDSGGRAVYTQQTTSPVAVASALKLAEREDELRRSSLQRVGLYAEDLAASNNWVISGKRTLDGKALLANDPHLQPAAPGIWYLSHLSTPAMRASGVTFPGVPGIVLGHNESIAWGATNVGPDVQDLYREEFNGEGKYKTEKGFVAPNVRREEIRVRTNPFKPETETEVYEVLETRNGVVITDEVGQKFALKWTARDPKNQEFEAFFRLNRAKNWKDFQASLRTYGGAMQNFVYADVAGNIGWYAAGRVPIRRTGTGALPYDGSTGAGDWVGYVPFEELPNLYNPPEGFIVTANQRIVGSSYKYFDLLARDAANPWRARRIYDLLKANTKVSMNDVRDVQHDVFSIPFSYLAREIVDRAAASPETMAVLRGWDGRTVADSKAAVLVNEIRNCVASKIADDNKPVPSFLVRERLLYWVLKENSARWLPKQFAGYDGLLKACDSESRTALAKRLGADDSKWRWGDVFTANFQHPLAVAPLIGGQFALRFNNVNGSGQTPNVGSYVSMRQIASPGNWDATRHVIPLGESGDPASPHWKDQFEAWRTGTPMIFPFTPNAVNAAAKSVTVLMKK
ncbi:MAG: penicillin acylase family protein [Acidobacteria bacterium]|nr:penicillin acylase family protein [Acidobacteriota bacterium]